MFRMTHRVSSETASYNPSKPSSKLESLCQCKLTIDKRPDFGVLQLKILVYIENFQFKKNNLNMLVKM